MSPATLSDTTTIRSFQVDVSEAELAELRRRLTDTRWPSKELVADPSQGVQLATIQALTSFWVTEYDWRVCEAKLNALPNFTTEIGRADMHFIHVRSPHEDALPLIITHGWPGSVIEMLEIVGPLTDPTAHGGRAVDAFHLVVPSLPGYGFSDAPPSLGWSPSYVAEAWAELMKRLGYTRYVAQGGDVGAAVTDAMAIQAPDGLAAIHLNFLRRPPAEILGAALGGAPIPELSDDELFALNAYATQFKKGYIAEQSQSPQTIGYSLTDSPVGLAAWIIDHDVDAHEKISRVFLDGRPSGHLSRETIVDNISLYWLTGTATSAARMYWEGARATAAAAGQGQPVVTVPVAFTVFPGEVYRAPRTWVERVYPNLIYFNEVERGGHFAAWEEPELFTDEMRAAFRFLR